MKMNKIPLKPHNFSQLTHYNKIEANKKENRNHNRPHETASRGGGNTIPNGRQ